jgi:hypothetical protein
VTLILGLLGALAGLDLVVESGGAVAMLSPSGQDSAAPAEVA